jgi:hypothetical protein
MMPVQKHPAQKDIASEDGEVLSSLSNNDPSTVDTASNNNPSNPDYFTRSTSQTLKAIAVFWLVYGHFYAFYIGGTTILRMGDFDFPNCFGDGVDKIVQF